MSYQITKNKKKMELEFAKYYDITDVAKSHNAEYGNYEKVFVSVDTNDFCIARILKGYHNDDDEGYVKDENSYITERNNIGKPRAAGIKTHTRLLQVLDEDDFLIMIV